jgi:hypothetical protein
MTKPALPAKILLPDCVKVDLGMVANPEVTFRGLPFTPYKRFLTVRYERLGAIPVRRELWSRSGVRCRSAIFKSAHVVELDDRALIRLALGDPDRMDDVTVIREGGFVFVNYSI